MNSFEVFLALAVIALGTVVWLQQRKIVSQDETIKFIKSGIPEDILQMMVDNYLGWRARFVGRHHSEMNRIILSGKLPTEELMHMEEVQRAAERDFYEDLEKVKECVKVLAKRPGDIHVGEDWREYDNSQEIFDSVPHRTKRR